jgi:hypothetical protein
MQAFIYKIYKLTGAIGLSVKGVCAVPVNSSEACCKQI